MSANRRPVALLTSFALAIALLLATLPVARAADGATVFTDETAFLDATAAMAVAFPGDADTALPSKPFGTGYLDYSCAWETLSLGGGDVTVTNPTPQWICFIGPDWNAPLSNTDPKPPSPTIVNNVEDDYDVMISFGEPQHAVALSLLTNSSAMETVTLHYSDSSSEVIPDTALDTDANRLEFIGFRSHVPIIGVELDTTGGATQNEGITGIWTSPFLLPPTTDCPDGGVFVSGEGTGSATPVVSVPTVAGYPYAVTASGTYFAGGTYAYDIQADAEYSEDAYQRVNGLPWTDEVHNYESYGEGLLELKVDDGFVEWNGFSSDHTYTIEYVATGSAIDFQIYDIFADNNTGGLCVDVDPIALTKVRGGGQIVELPPHLRKPFKVSFGGNLKDIDGELRCQWQVNLHNVGNDELDKAKFHATDCFDLTTWQPGAGGTEPADPDSDGVVRFHASGKFNGESGYTAIFRMEDFTEPGDMDSLRIEIFDTSSALVYDTMTDFPGESNNIGTARHRLDRGNIQITFYE